MVLLFLFPIPILVVTGEDCVCGGFVFQSIPVEYFVQFASCWQGIADDVDEYLTYIYFYVVIIRCSFFFLQQF